MKKEVKSNRTDDMNFFTFFLKFCFYFLYKFKLCIEGNKMNKEVKDKWLKALRSGEYKQSYRRLHDLKGYCCLGVLCDLYIKENKEKAEWEISVNRDWYILKGINTSYSQFLPSYIEKWAGVNEVGNSVWIEGDGYPLVSHNDRGRTFLEIADAIEKQL